ncbi:arsenate reductase [Streptococcus criceti]|uniref:ArsC family protein n=1 Tax=Streptococcus criceti HS-6 TaxID=873449 RepID=G5JSN2_STRCG|nr:arsenate reductase family protein [Streptococcus criceti]EHI73871.1 ArsC family protein [Streptococcus criceti HS-6]SUN37511.1 arsenate reductase [Streptococcus criceti]
MIIFYQYPKCTTCKRAKAELDELGWNYEAIDIKANPPKAEELKKWIGESGGEVKKFFNTSGQSYRALDLKDKIDKISLSEAADLLAADGMLIKRPLLVKDGKLLQIGYRTLYINLDL